MALVGRARPPVGLRGELLCCEPAAEEVSTDGADGAQFAAHVSVADARREREFVECLHEPGAVGGGSSVPVDVARSSGGCNGSAEWWFLFGGLELEDQERS